ncbi:MAG: mandelate racemase/muconate lactonizing enzyme family protein [Granulosicoccus sp.]|nr:mandelate racemase/muconate lactonizing enzyme family protein [Granulosicoccus sp.]
MRITDLDVKRYADPDNAKSASGYGAQIIVVRLSTDSGITGLSFISGSEVSAPIIELMLCSAIRPYLLGKDPTETSVLWDAMYHELLPRRGGDGLMRHAIAAVDFALWDVKGKVAGLPVWRLLGSRRKNVPTYANCAHHLPVDALAERASEYVKNGHRALKIRGTRSFVSLAEATARVIAVREAVGPDVRIMVDVNGTWDVDTAIRQLRDWKPYNVYWLEEPVPPHDFDGYRRVKARSGDTYIVGGEQHVGLAEFKNLIEHDCVDIVQPNAALTGGITDWLQIHAYATARSIPVSPWNLQQVHIHMAAALPNVQWIEYFMPDNALLEFQGKLLAGSSLTEVRQEDGLYLEAPESPGLGIELDAEIADRAVL